MSALFIRIHGIEVVNDFEVYYTTGVTPGDHITGGTPGFTLYDDYSSGTTEITITGLTYDTQYWFKILDKVNGTYIIENVRTHSLAYYLVDCDPTPTPTITITPEISGVTPTITPTYTPTPYQIPTFIGVTRTLTPTVTPTYTITPTPTYTKTPTPTPALLTLAKYCYLGNYACGDTLYEINGHEPNTGSVTYWDEYGNINTDYHCADDGLITVWSSAKPTTVAMHLTSCEPTITCSNYSIGYSNYMPGSTNLWEAQINLPQITTTTYTFTVSFTATRIDTTQSYNGSIDVTVNSGTNSANASMSSPDYNNSYENWRITSYSVTQIFPSGSGYIFNNC